MTTSNDLWITRRIHRNRLPEERRVCKCKRCNCNRGVRILYHLKLQSQQIQTFRHSSPVVYYEEHHIPYTQLQHSDLVNSHCDCATYHKIPQDKEHHASHQVYCHR